MRKPYTPEKIQYPLPETNRAYALFLLSFGQLVQEMPHVSGDLARLVEKAVKEWDTDSPWQDRVIVNRRGDEIFRPSTILYGESIAPMLDLMMKRHENQIRKGDGADYREHPLEVSHILRQYGFDGETIAAGLGHDLLEDTDVTEEEIVQAGGEEVLELIKTLSQPDLKDWRVKKLHHITQIQQAGPRAAAVFTADHIANLRAALDGLQKQGDSFWKNFNASREDKLWYEQMGLEVVKWQLLQHPMVEELGRLVSRFQVLSTGEGRI